MPEHGSPQAGTVRSRDGTVIAYERFGEGPSVILVGGGLTSGLRTFPSFVDLAGLLASRFMVLTWDRRGRGGSGDTAPYAVEREIEDLEALIAEAGGPSRVHGLSSGAVLAVRAAAGGASIGRLTLFEPPPPDDAPDRVPPWERSEQIKAGRRTETVEQFLAGVGLSPTAIDAMRRTAEWPRLEAVAHTLPYEGAVTTRWMERAGSIHVPTLVIDSDASSAFLREAAAAAAAAVPGAERRTVPGTFHDAPARILAPVLAEFFGA